MKTLRLLGILFSLLCSVKFAQAQNTTPVSSKQEVIKQTDATYFDMIDSLSRVKNNAETVSSDVVGWKGSNAKQDIVDCKKLYDKLRSETNATIDLCKAILTNPALARRDNAKANNLKTDINKMVAANNALHQFYTEKQPNYGGNGLGIPDAIMSILTGGATQIFNSVIATINAKQTARALVLDDYKIPVWPGAAAPAAGTYSPAQRGSTTRNTTATPAPRSAQTPRH